MSSEARTIFYSWQSDRPNRTNRGFIGDSLVRVADDIRADKSLAIEPSIDRDTAGVPGSPAISDTILRKIDESDVFVCDVSLTTAPDASRPSPNPNVLLELGYAVSELGWDRVVMVMNTAFGDVNQLPFDLRGRRVLPYSLPDPPGEAKAEVRRDLERRLKETLVPILNQRRDQRLLVRAYERGTYKGVQRGYFSEFRLEDPAHFSEVWMVRVGVDNSNEPPSGALPVSVRAAPAASSGFGVEFLVKSESDRAIRSARFVVVNILLWDERMGAYVETDDVHSQESFTPRVLDTHDLFPGADIRYGSAVDDDHYVYLTKGSGIKASETACRWWGTGVRRIDYRIVDAENREKRGAICLRCGQYGPPKLVDCPSAGAQE